jgi:signal transduction histidine kinase
MLARRRVEDDQHKQRAYELMLSESDRLRRLVESLLDFGRMQARQYKFRSDNIDPAELCRAVVEEFQETVRDLSCSVEFSGLADGAKIRGDRAAIRTAS